MIVVSPEMFEAMTKRAYKIAALQFEQICFDMTDENKAQCRDILIESYVERIMERWGQAAAELIAETEVVAA